MRQALKIVGQICREHFFTIFCFAMLHRGLFYETLRFFYLLLLGKDSVLWGRLLQPDVGVWFALIFLGGLVVFFVLWEIAAYLLLYQRCHEGRAVSLFAMVFEGMGQVVRICRPENFWLFPVLLIVLPFQVVMTWSGIFLAIEIPHFMLQFLEQSPVLLAFTNLLLLGIQLLGIESLFLFHFLFLKGKSALEAWEGSRRMGLRRLGETCALLCLWNILSSLGSFLIYQGAVAAAFLLPSADAALFCLAGVEKVILFLQQCLFVPISIAIVHSCYLVFFQGEESFVCFSGISLTKRIFSLLIWVTMFILCGGYFLYFYGQVGDGILAAVPVIAAHRGYSETAPENTVAAILAARDIGVDCIEIDVQMTRDGQIVLFHDGDLFRTLGVSKTVGEMEYKDIKALVDEKYANSPQEARPLPLLEDVLAAGGGSMGWNIELKTYSLQNMWGYLLQGIAAPFRFFDKNDNHIYEEDEIKKKKLVAEALALLAEKGISHRVVVSSLDYEVLQLVKEENPAMETLYILPFVGNRLENLSAADGYSVEISSLQPYAYRQIKKMGKSLWVWTVNDIAAAAKLTSFSVDGVITDQPLLLKKILNSEGKIHHRQFFQQFLFSWF